jgi:hypothetical protein
MLEPGFEVKNIVASKANVNMGFGFGSTYQ